MPDSLAQRLRETEAQSVDRRKISEQSRRALAEAHAHADPAAFRAHVFAILTGESIESVPLVRDVRGAVAVSDAAAADLDGRQVVVDVTVGDETDRAYADADGGAYRFGERSEGEHPVTASVIGVVATDPETLTRTRYAVDDATVSVASPSVIVDTKETPIGDAVAAPTVTVESLTVGAEVAEW